MVSSLVLVLALLKLMLMRLEEAECVPFWGVLVRIDLGVAEALALLLRRRLEVDEGVLFETWS
jgi:hypothetical protein